MVANSEDGHYFSQTFGYARTLLISLTKLLYYKGIKVLFFIAGFGLTYLILEYFYGKFALSQFLRGISVFNLIDTIIEQNLSELSIMIYFAFLFGFFLFFDRILIRRVIYSDYQTQQASMFPQVVRYFREGSFTLPFIVMIGSPLLIQLILPIVIVFIALVELLAPFVIVGEIYRLSENNFRKVRKEIRWRKSREQDHSEVESQENIPKQEPVTMKQSEQIPTSVVISTLIMSLIFPIAVILLVAIDLDQLLHILHYMLLNENSGKGLSPLFWEIINTIIGVISLNIEFLLALFNSIKHFIITFLVLIPICKIYIFIVRSSRIQITRILETYVFRY